jgi:hypothetical protein
MLKAQPLAFTGAADTVLGGMSAVAKQIPQWPRRHMILTRT